MPPVTDIIMLTHNRLEHLEATVRSLEERTRAPYRLTIVDNASGPEVRNWLAANRERFHQIIPLAENEFLTALNHGIAATVSDPFMVTDPDLILPELEPCWLTRLHEAMERNPDFGLLGVGLDQSNLPPVQDPERIEASEIVDGTIVERPVGSIFTLIRRAALNADYETDWRTCQSVARAGYRYGWLLDIRAYHLGWDDYKLYPGHLASKLVHGEYREVNLIERAPTLPELALAGPVVAQTRAAGVPDASVLELTWSAPAVAAAVPGAVAIERPEGERLPLGGGAAGAVVIVDPPAAEARRLVTEACRVAAGLVVVVAPLATFSAGGADELAPEGWSGVEAAGPGDVPFALAEASVGDDGLREQIGVRTLDDRERWLELFAAAAFGAGRRRLWIFRPESPPAALPEAVVLDPAVRPWRPVAVVPQAPPRSLTTRLRDRAARERRVAAERLRIRAARLRRAAAG
jgi:hypothetical protein